jgi:hypothetical protein
MLGEWGRAEEAIPILEHAIKIQRVHADRGHEFTATLAGTLKNLGSELKETGSRARAIETLTESVGMYRELIGEGRPEYEVALAQALNSLGNARDLDPAAMDDFDAAIPLLRKQDLDDFPESAMLLAAVLASECGVLIYLKEYERALANADEAVAIFRRLGEDNPGGVEPYVGRSLGTKAEALLRLDRLGESHAAATESIEIIRRCYAANPDGWRKQLIAALRVLVELLPRLDRAAEADDIAVETDQLVAEDDADVKPLHRPAPEKRSFLPRFRRER